MKLISEIGINHNGKLEDAINMIQTSAECGADYVKFQKRDINTVYTKEFLDSHRESPWGTTQREQKEGLEFSFDDYKTIDSYCKGIGIEWFASAWDFKSLEMMESFNPPMHKIASAFNCHIPFMEAVAKLKRPVMLSTGMANIPIIDNAVKLLRSYGVPIILMHCVSIYPCPDELCNISAIHTLRTHYPDCEIGYSGHERGITPSLTAIAYGAKYIERHFTLDRAMYGSDQSASLEPKGLSRVREYGDQVEACIGTGEITIEEGEEKCAKSLRYWL